MAAKIEINPTRVRILQPTDELKYVLPSEFLLHNSPRPLMLDMGQSVMAVETGKDMTRAREVYDFVSTPGETRIGPKGNCISCEGVDNDCKLIIRITHLSTREVVGYKINHLLRQVQQNGFISRARSILASVR